MKKQVLSIIDVILDPSAPILLGVSGGPDSMALLSIFIDLMEERSFSIHVAHYHHGYRKESDEEAFGIFQFCSERNIPFHMEKLEGSIPSSNIEDYFREKRYQFFEKVYHQIGASALLLGHHRDDQVETTLKRWFEGASLPHLSGMSVSTHRNEMKIVRPLLSFTKKEILLYISKKNIPYYIDKTNEDPKFLRGRFRQAIIPYLEEHFGKGIQGNILRIGDLMKEMDDYLYSKTLPLLSKGKPLLGGWYFSLSDLSFSHPLEIRHFLTTWAHRNHIGIRFQELEILIALITKRATSKEVKGDGWTWYVEKEHLFAVPDDQPRYISENGPFFPLYWKNLHQNRLILTRPGQEYELAIVPMSTFCIEGISLGEWYNLHKIPPFLRKKIPCFAKDGIVHHELLTGKMLKNKQIC